MFKKTKLYVGVALVVNAVTSLITFIILLFKKKSSAGAFLAVSAMSGAAGAYLLYDCKDDINFCDCDFNFDDDLTDDCDCDCDCDNCDADDCEAREDDMNLDGNLFSRENEE